jgi:hypothetical protein
MNIKNILKEGNTRSTILESKDSERTEKRELDGKDDNKRIIIRKF